jgi:hypothetical protein
MAREHSQLHKHATIDSYFWTSLLLCVVSGTSFGIAVTKRALNIAPLIGRIGNLSNRQLYEFDEAEVRKS